MLNWKRSPKCPPDRFRRPHGITPASSQVPLLKAQHAKRSRRSAPVSVNLLRGGRLDTFVIPTAKSITHPDTLRGSSGAGFRYALSVMPGVNKPDAAASWSDASKSAGLITIKTLNINYWRNINDHSADSPHVPPGSLRANADTAGAKRAPIYDVTDGEFPRPTGVA